MRRTEKEPWFRGLTTFVLSALLVSLTQDVGLVAQAQESPQALFDAGVSAYKLVELGKAEEYLNRAAQLLAKTEEADPAAKRLNAMVHLYLGRVAAVADRPDEARTHFSAALKRDPSLVMVTETDPPKIVQLFDETKSSMPAAQAGIPTPIASPAVESAQIESASTPAEPTPAPAPKRKKKKWIWWALGGAAVATAAILAVGSGGGSSGDSPEPIVEMGTIVNPQEKRTVAVATKSGNLRARVTWRNGTVEVSIQCLNESGFPCMGGVYNRTSNTSSDYAASVTQQTYLIVLTTDSLVPEPYSLTVEYP